VKTRKRAASKPVGARKPGTFANAGTTAHQTGPSKVRMAALSPSISGPDKKSVAFGSAPAMPLRSGSPGREIKLIGQGKLQDRGKKTTRRVGW
jgi:hypothetical protein